MARSPLFRLLAVLFALVLVGAACSSRDDDSGSGDVDTEDTSGDTGSGDGDEASSIPTDDCLVDPTEEIEGDVIKLVSSYPQSGLAARFAEIGRGLRSYFEYINDDQGGVDLGGRTFTIETEDRDDEDNAQKTAANIEDLAGADGRG